MVITAGHFTRIAGHDFWFTWLTCDGLTCLWFAGLTSGGFARVATVPNDGKAAKNAGFGTGCCRDDDDRSEHRYHNFMFHLNSPNDGLGKCVGSVCHSFVMSGYRTNT
jgi:hypothetical protein